MITRVRASVRSSRPVPHLHDVTVVFLVVVALILVVPASASASCAASTVPRADRLAQIAQGRSGYDVAFVGRLARRWPAVDRGGSFFTPLDFDVSRSFGDELAKRTRILLAGGCVGDLCEAESESVTYTSQQYQLVLANRGAFGFESASGCSDAGPLSAEDLATLRRSSVLPNTGQSIVTQLAVILALLFAGSALMLAGRARTFRQ